MDCVDGWCPSCVTNCMRITSVYFSKKFGKKKKSYEGLNELEQEQFRFRERGEKKRIFEENIASSDIRNKIQQPSRSSLKEDVDSKKLNVEMQIELALNDEVPKQSQKKSNMNMNLLEEEEKTNIFDFPEDEHSQFKVNIDPFSKYYELLIEKTKNIGDLFKLKGQELKLGDSVCSFRAQQCESTDGQVFLFSYKLPCSYSFYSNINNNHSENIAKSFNPVIDDYALLDSIQNNLKVNYLSLTKFMILEPREFTYAKYSHGLNNHHWEVCVTLEDLQEYANQKPKNSSGKRVAGDFFIVSYLKETNLGANPVLEVKTYCCVDIKSSIKTQKFFSRGMTEVKGYFEKMYGHCQESFQEELA